MTKIQRCTAISFLVVMLVSMFSFTKPAAAGHEKTWNYARIGLGGLAAYSLIKGKTTTGLILGAGAVYANDRYRKARRNHDFDRRFNDDFDRDRDFDRFQRSRR